MAYEITERDARLLQGMRDSLAARGRVFPAPQRRRRMHSGGAVVAPSASVDIKYVLIDADIKGAADDSPALFMLPADVELTSAQITDGWQAVLQDPFDSDYTKNNVTELQLCGYTGRAVELKYFETELQTLTAVTPADGTTTTIKLASTGVTGDGDTINTSVINNEYKGDTITITDGPGNGQVATILSYDGPTRIATINTTWAVAPVKNNTKYELSRNLHRVLATTTTEDTPNKRKIARYSLTTVYYDAGEDFKVGTYQKTDYPGYPENDIFPPDGNGTYKKMPSTYFNRKYRAIAINSVLITAFCEQLPAPALVPK